MEVLILFTKKKNVHHWVQNTYWAYKKTKTQKKIPKHYNEAVDEDMLQWLKYGLAYCDLLKQILYLEIFPYHQREFPWFSISDAPFLTLSINFWLFFFETIVMGC